MDHSTGLDGGEPRTVQMAPNTTGPSNIFVVQPKAREPKSFKQLETNNLSPLLLDPYQSFYLEIPLE